MIRTLPAARESVRDSLASLRTTLRDVDTRARAAIQARPLTALVGAVAVGFLLRRLLRFGRS